MIRAASAVAACLCATSFGQEFQIDANAMTTHASGPFSEMFTGMFSVTNTLADPDVDGDSSILDVLIDGVRQHSGGATSGAFAFELDVEFAGGDIVSGFLSVSHDSTGSENVYSAELSPTAGGAILEIGDGTFVIGGMTFEGMWVDPSGTFLGVDISPWGSAQPLLGRFSDIAFTPNDDHMDPDTDVDVFMLVPAPAGGLLFGVGALAFLRRRH